MNIVAVNPLSIHPLQQISSEICGVLDQFYSNGDKIQIEFKYAKFVQFCESMFLHHLQHFNLPREIQNQIRGPLQFYVLQQNSKHLESLKKLSYSSMLILNKIGRIYRLDSQFDEEQHKKFYKIREFLIKLCRQNNSESSNKLNFFNQIKNENMLNRTFVLQSENQIRLDIIITNGEDSGRYSYLVKDGWTKIQKQNLIRQKQYDLMMSEKLFRLAIKRQDQKFMTFPQVRQIFEKVKQTKFLIIRCKRAIRVVKNEELQFSLSEIYQPIQHQEKFNEHFEDLKDLLYLQPENLDEFACRIFQNFYFPQQQKRKSQSKFQIQCEFTQNGIKQLNNLREARKHRELQKFVDSAISQLYGLYYLDHSEKKRQIMVLENMKENKEGSSVECRLENEFGSYMHDLVYQKISEQ